IDPTSMDAVLWSLAYRTNPIEDVHLVLHRGGVQGAQYGPKTSDSGMLVDATRKYPMAPLALPTRDYMEHARALWEELDLYPLSVQSPWHGYGLGDWTDRWETFARRAATGDWEVNGREPLARPRRGLSLGRLWRAARRRATGSGRAARRWRSSAAGLRPRRPPASTTSRRKNRDSCAFRRNESARATSSVCSLPRLRGRGRCGAVLVWLLLIHHTGAQRADAGNLDLEHVAWLHPQGRIAAVTGALRGASGDHVAGRKRCEIGAEGDD